MIKQQTENRILSGSVSSPTPVIDVGAYSSLATAVATIGTVERTTLVVTDDQYISDDLEVTSNLSLVVMRPGALRVAAGKTLTISGPFQSDLSYIFTGDGAVVFGADSIRFYEPIWFNSTDQPPIANTFAVGAITKNISPAVGSPKGWVCTVAGTPGTWVSEGNL